MLLKTKDEIDVILNQGLMFHCLNWGEPGCRPEIAEFFDLHKTRLPKDETRRLPTIDELIKLNEVCKQCPKAYLEIKKKECSACGSNKIVDGFTPNFNPHATKKPRLLYSYYCVSCGKYLFSGVKF